MVRFFLFATVFLCHVQPPLSTAALCLAHNLQSLLFCIRDITAASGVSDSNADTHSLLVSNVVQLVWSDEWNIPVPEVWVGKDEGEGERRVFSASSNYYLVSDII